MSPKNTSYLLMFFSIVVGVGPHIPDLMTNSDLHASPWVKFVCAIVACAAGVVGFRLPAQGKLADGNGKNSSGGPGVKLDGTPHPGPAAAPPASPYRVNARVVRGAFAGFFMFLTGIYVCPGCGATPAQVNTVTTQALSVEGLICFVDELADPLLPTGDPQTIAVFVQGACAKDIPQSLTSLVATLITGLMAPSPDAGAATVDAGALAHFRARYRLVAVSK